MPWRPGAREARQLLEQPYEDVPPHLKFPLWNWIEQHLRTPEAVVAVALSLRMELPDARTGVMAHQTAIQRLAKEAESDPSFMLDLTELILKSWAWEDDLRDLESVLGLADSIYTLREDGRGLELRVLPEVKEEVQAVVDEAAGSAGAHLANAWGEAYGRAVDPVKAYSEAIKAVEAAAVPIISPRNSKATLGTLIGELKANQGRWQFEINASMPLEWRKYFT